MLELVKIMFSNHPLISNYPITKLRSYPITLFCVLLVCAIPAQAQSQQKTKHSGAPGSTKTNIEVCNLLTSAEIQAVLGEAAKQTKSSTQPGMAGSAKSVSLAVARTNPADNSKLTPRAFWRKQFHPSDRQSDRQEGKEQAARAGKVGERSEAEREEELRKARAITGIGEEAYWVGNPILGALYVLQGDMFLRISVGGIRQEPERIEKSKALARAALKHL